MVSLTPHTYDDLQLSREIISPIQLITRMREVRSYIRTVIGRQGERKQRI